MEIRGAELPMPIRSRVVLAAVAALLAAGCANRDRSSIDPNSTVGDVAARSDGGGLRLPIPGGRSRSAAPVGLGVNAFLWSATLDTIEVMPLESADPYSGLITTEWYANPEDPSERFKLSVRILDTRLRADGLKATLYRQVYAGDSRGWIDGSVDDNSAIQIENAILTRAQQLRIQTLR
jgi:hypothetical protein